jgi:hypothetical protein
LPYTEAYAIDIVEAKALAEQLARRQAQARWHALNLFDHGVGLAIHPRRAHLDGRAHMPVQGQPEQQLQVIAPGIVIGQLVAVATRSTRLTQQHTAPGFSIRVSTFFFYYNISLLWRISGLFPFRSVA